MALGNKSNVHRCFGNPAPLESGGKHRNKEHVEGGAMRMGFSVSSQKIAWVVHDMCCSDPDI